MTTPHDWPNVAYPDLTCSICGATFSGPHNAGKCYLHKDEPTPEIRLKCRTPDEAMANLAMKVVDAQQHIAELQAEVATLRCRIDFFGCPEKLCLLCGAEGPCDLHCPGTDGQPDPELEVICTYDHTYPQLIAIAHKATAEARELRRDRERMAWLNGLDAFEMVRVYYDGPQEVKLSVNFGASVYGDTVAEAIDKAANAEKKQ